MKKMLLAALSCAVLTAGAYAEDQLPKVSFKTQAAIVQVVATLKAGGFSGIQWTAKLPMGARFVRVPLPSLTEKHPDGYSYAAQIPVGIVAPNTPLKDPNQASRFIIERSGGLAGLTQYSQSIPMPALGGKGPFDSQFYDGEDGR